MGEGYLGSSIDVFQKFFCKLYDYGSQSPASMFLEYGKTNTLLMIEEDDTLYLQIRLNSAIKDAFDKYPVLAKSVGLCHENLEEVLVVLEETSHFTHAMHFASYDKSFSPLDLEILAAIDKYQGVDALQLLVPSKFTHENFMEHIYEWTHEGPEKERYEMANSYGKKMTNFLYKREQKERNTILRKLVRANSLREMIDNI